MPQRVAKVACTCRGCGAVFHLNPGQIARGRGKYCGAACYHAANAGERVEIECARCGRKVRVYRLYVDRGQYRYCSDDCRRNRNRTPEERTRVCATCGREFTVKDVTSKRRVHCSLACRRRLVKRRCERCGMVFKTKRVRGNARYCSRTCYLWATESDLQRQVREALDALGIRYDREKKVGRYNVDFFLPDHGVALEVDGDYWHGTERQKRKDLTRDAFLAGRGLRVAHLSAAAVRGDVTAALREVIDAVAT